MDMPIGAWGGTYDAVSWPDNERHRKFYQLYYNMFPNKPKNEPPHGFTSPGYYMVQLIGKAMGKAGTTDPQPVLKAMEGLEFDTFNGPIRIREFDHQVTSGYVWGPMIEKQGSDYLVMDPKRQTYVPIGDDLYTREEWLAARRLAGKK